MEYISNTEAVKQVESVIDTAEEVIITSTVEQRLNYLGSMEIKFKDSLVPLHLKNIKFPLVAVTKVAHKGHTFKVKIKRVIE